MWDMQPQQNALLYVDPKPCVCKSKLYELVLQHIGDVHWASLPKFDECDLIRDNRRREYTLCWYSPRGNRTVAQLIYNHDLFLLNFEVYGQRNNCLHRLAMRIDLYEMQMLRLIQNR